MFEKSVLLFFLFAIISPVYSAKCNDADQKQIDICMKKNETDMAMIANTENTDANSQKLWEIKKTLYNCMKPFKCGDIYDRPASLEGMLLAGFLQSLADSAFDKCLDPIGSPCVRELFDQMRGFYMNGVKNAEDEKKYCEVLKGLPSCMLLQNKRRKKCEDKQINHFQKIFDDLYKTVKCQ